MEKKELAETLLDLIKDYFDETGVIREDGRRVVEADLLKFAAWLKEKITFL